MSAKKVARFSVFSQYQTLPSPSQRFVSNILFDRNVLSLIEDFIVFPADHPKWNILLQRCFNNHELCFNFLSGDLWVSAADYITIYSTDDSDLQPVKIIKCGGIVSSIHSTANGLMVTSECYPHQVMVYDVYGSHVRRICEEKIGCIYGVAINNTLQQVAITDWNTCRIDIYNLDGLSYRTLKTTVTQPAGLCWNEKDSLLYISSLTDRSIHVIDVKKDKCISTWGDKYPAQLEYPTTVRYNAYTQELFVNDPHQKRILVLGLEGVPTKIFPCNCISPDEFVLHPDDVSGRVIVCTYDNRIHLAKSTDLVCL